MTKKSKGKDKKMKRKLEKEKRASFRALKRWDLLTSLMNPEIRLLCSLFLAGLVFPAARAGFPEYINTRFAHCFFVFSHSVLLLTAFYAWLKGIPNVPGELGTSFTTKFPLACGMYRALGTEIPFMVTSMTSLLDCVFVIKKYFT